MKGIKILICKIAIFGLKLLGKGGSFPGIIGLYLDKNMMSIVLVEPAGLGRNGWVKSHYKRVFPASVPTKNRQRNAFLTVMFTLKRIQYVHL